MAEEALVQTPEDAVGAGDVVGARLRTTGPGAVPPAPVAAVAYVVKKDIRGIGVQTTASLSLLRPGLTLF